MLAVTPYPIENALPFIYLNGWYLMITASLLPGFTPIKTLLSSDLYPLPWQGIVLDG